MPAADPTPATAPALAAPAPTAAALGPTVEMVAARRAALASLAAQGGRSSRFVATIAPVVAVRSPLPAALTGSGGGALSGATRDARLAAMAAAAADTEAERRRRMAAAAAADAAEAAHEEAGRRNWRQGR